MRIEASLEVRFKGRSRGCRRGLARRECGVCLICCRASQIENTPLIEAAREGCVAVVEKLLAWGADKQAPGEVSLKGGYE